MSVGASNNWPESTDEYGMALVSVHVCMTWRATMQIALPTLTQRAYSKIVDNKREDSVVGIVSFVRCCCCCNSTSAGALPSRTHKDDAFAQAGSPRNVGQVDGISISQGHRRDTLGRRELKELMTQRGLAEEGPGRAEQN
jgi:hypothetical protein